MRKHFVLLILLGLTSFTYAAECVSDMEAVDEENGVYRCVEGEFTEGLFPDYVKEIILVNKEYGLLKVPSFRGTVKKGRLNGKAKVLYFTGAVQAEMNYLNDEIHGKYTTYYQTGELQLEANFVKGKQEGKATEYHPNGKVMKTLFYKNGKLEGKMKSYCENGKLYATQTFHNDERVGLVQCADGRRGQSNIKCSCE